MDAELNAALGTRYDILRELGQGGSATVYLAIDRKLERPVAMKVLHPQLDAVLVHGRFLAEIRTTARLQHPHILPLFDSGEADGRLYFTMPYVEGASLRDRLEREHRLPVTDVLRWASEVGSALEYAHTRGIIHRDIKPENILISITGHALVADFGIAYALDEARSLIRTDPALVVGTPAYMSPEQAEGERELDGRSDMYSLACVLYEALSGLLPPSASATPLGLGRRLREPVPTLRKARAAVSAPADRAIRRALVRDRAQRFSTMFEFVDSLRQATRIEIVTLGSLSVRVDGHPLPDGAITPAGLACLALLARAGDRGVKRNHAVGLLWDRGADGDGQRLLEAVLAEIGRAFGTTGAIVGDDRLQLDPVLVDCDVGRFEVAVASGRLAEAAAAYRGSFLDGFALPGSPAFNGWVRKVEAELARDVAAVLERLAREAERRGDRGDAVWWWRRLAAQDPLNGRITLSLMQALAAAGDRNAAIEHAEIHQALIEEAVGLPVDHAVVDLAARLERERTPPPSTAAPPGAPDPSTMAGP